MSPALELLLGSFKLEGTGNVIDAGEAAKLIPLWQAYKALSQGDTTASEELDALVAQIKETMKPEQVEAIEAMNLTPQDMFTLMQEQGIANNLNVVGNVTGTPGPGAVEVFGEGFSSSRGDSSGGMPPSGVNPGGGPPAGGITSGGGIIVGGGPESDLGQGSGQNLDPQAMATLQAERPQRAGIMNRVPTALIDALIELLQSK